MTITDFLEARIADDEAFITAPRGFTGHEVHLSDPIGAYSPRCPTCVGVHSGERMRAECAAKRVILGTYDAVEANRNTEGSVQWHEEKALLTAVRALASVYKDHPDYRQEWVL